MTSNENTLHEYNWNFYDELLENEDIDPFIDCMTCGKCVGDCIAANNSNFNFRKIIQKIIDGDKKGVLDSSEIWKCFLCGLCTVKCPKNIQIKKLILILRKLAIESGRGFDLLKYISDLPEGFLKDGLIVGRMNTNLREKLGLPREYKLSEKALKELAVILKATGLEKSTQEFLKNIAKQEEKK